MKLQKSLTAIGVRITRGFENDIYYFQIQIVTQIGQKVDFININIQKEKKKIIDSFLRGLQMLRNDIKVDNQEAVYTIYENINYLLNQNKDAETIDHNDIKNILSPGFKFINSLLNDQSRKLDEMYELKLDMLNKNMVLVYNETAKIFKANRENFTRV
jgi:hypothetical protein